jgi:ketosteroid isomerase-like protein
LGNARKAGLRWAKDEDGKAVDHSYCKVWRFHDGWMAELHAFVIETDPAH